MNPSDKYYGMLKKYVSVTIDHPLCVSQWEFSSKRVIKRKDFDLEIKSKLLFLTGRIYISEINNSTISFSTHFKYSLF